MLGLYFTDFRDTTLRPIGSPGIAILWHSVEFILDYYKYFFFPLAIVQWNALPANVAVAPSLEIFKAAVEHPPLFKKSPDSVPTDHNSKRLLQIHLLSSDNNTLERPTTPHTHPAYLGTVQYSCLPGSPLHSLDNSICFIF